MSKPSDRLIGTLTTSHQLMVRNPSSSGTTANWGYAPISGLSGLLGSGTPVDNTPPVISTPAAFAVAENTIFSVQLTANKAVTWAIIPGAASPDFAAYTINGNILSFISTLDVDFEDPDDLDGNNSYIVTVQATDSNGNASTKKITVTILDVVEIFAPQILVAPLITGSPRQGQTLTVSTGTWSDTPSAYAYQYRRDGIPIANAIQPTYALTADDVGHMISVTVTAINATGSGSENAPEVGPVVPAAPVNTAQPEITGTVQVGKTLTVSNGTWTNSPTNYSRQWRNNGTAISGATGATYIPVTSDVGATLTCVITATNAGGSTNRTSTMTAPVIAAGTALAVSGTPVTSTTVNTVYTGFQVSAAGGTSPYTYSVFAGTLPPGISLNASTGAVSGTSTTSGSYTGIVIRATDSASPAATVNLPSFDFTVNSAITPLTISGVPGQATVGTAYTFTPTVTGGQGTKSFTLSGTLPAGLSFSSTTGAITGTPTNAGTISGISITVTDNSGSAVLNISVSVQSAGGMLLDSITATASAAYSLRKLRSTYNGFCIKVRRNSDNLEQDIGFDGSGVVDTAAILAFVGSTSTSQGNISTWYDQSPAGKDATQTSLSNQPFIVRNGAIWMSNGRPAIYVLNNTGFTSGVAGGPSAKSTRVVGTWNGSVVADFVKPSQNLGRYVRVNASTGALELLQATSSGGTLVGSTTTFATANTLSTFATNYDSTSWSAAINGGTPASGSNSITFLANITSIIGRTASIFTLSSFIEFDSVISQSDSDKIQASQKTFYNTP